jgi:Leucine-rich repeat (LRR) protein
MKKTALLFMFTIISLMSIHAQQTYISDANFEAYLEANGMGNGTVNDNYVTTASISGVTTLDVSNQNIADLTGIQDFTSLQSLIANGNQLTTVDISANTSLQYVLVSNNLIQDLTLPTTTTLRQISCNNNQLSSIYLNNVTGLRSLYINHNQLTDLDVSSNTQLTSLQCYNNQLTQLTLNANTALTTLICSSNALTSLDVSSNTQLSYLSCHSNQLTQLNLGTNNNLSRLFCSTNQLTILNISNQTNLSVLECQNNLLNSLDLSLHTSLTRLMIYNNQLTFLDIKNANNAAIANNSIYLNDNPNLTCIYVDDVTWSETNWTHVDANSHFVADTAGCDYYYQTTNIPDANFENYLETHNSLGQAVSVGDTSSLGNGIANDHLVLTHKIADLTSLNISNQSISDLTGIQDFIHLDTFNCSNNSITVFDYPTLLNLLSIEISNNNLSSLNVSAYTNLILFKCNDNQLTSLDIRNGNNGNIDNAGFDAGNNPDLTCIYVDDATWSTSNWTHIDTSSHFVADTAGCDYYTQTTNIPDANFENYLETHNSLGQAVSVGDASSLGNGIANDHLVLTHKLSEAINIRVANLHIADLSGIEECTVLTNLNCNFNDLTQLDLSHNPDLVSLLCSDNQLTTLNLTGCSRLTELSASNNAINSLDISTLTALQNLSVNHNQLTSIDLSANAGLTAVSANNNLLSNIVFASSHPVLEMLDLADNLLVDLDISMLSALLDLSAQNNQLQSLDARVGSLDTVFITNNPDLDCVLVNNVQDAYDYWSYDLHTHFALDANGCQVFDTHTYVPDDNFEQALIDLGYDDVLNDLVLTANIDTVTNLDISNLSIINIQGIEAFAALSSFDCSQNSIAEIDLRENTQLTSLNCSANFLSYLNVQNGNNQQITNFDAHNNSSLTCIYVDDSTYSTSNWTNIDTQSYFVNNETECQYFSTHTYVPDNNFEQFLIDNAYDDVLDDYVLTSNISSITSLTIPNLGIADLTGIEDFTSLTGIDCHGNLLTELDFGTINILGVDCHDNQIISLDFSNNHALLALDCHNNSLTSLNLQNGNNNNFTNQYFDTRANPNLICIFVDDATFCSQNLLQIDTQSHFVETQAQCDALSVNDMQNTGLNIFPNPVDNQLNIVSDTPVNQVRIFDVLGNQLLSLTPNSNIFSMDVSSLATGTYIVRIISNDKTYSYKIIK